jgi:ABC-type multidrug transport system ATPase subunit/pSer/pThr/pTyr-binding forkhead associated (FHA) protein/ABC-type multidrug transport system permease subunit
MIGRGEECEIVLDTPRVSSRHARIFADEWGAWVEDFDSTNGTFVNEERLEKSPRALASGDRVRIDDQVLVVLAGDKTTVEPRRPRKRARGPLAEPTSVDLTAAPLTIGRDKSNVLTLDDPNVSRFHAVITRNGSEVELRDLSSRNGTRVDGELVTRATLSPGAELAIGAYRLTFTGTGLIPRDDRQALRLEAHGVAMSVGGTALLAPTSLVVEPGELVAIIGESGAGKTTLLKALAGITRPTAGDVLVNGEPVATRLTDVGYVPQDDIVHRLLRVREALRYSAQLRLPPDTSAAEIDQAVSRVLSELDLEAHSETLVGKLSGGQRKRVGVAVELLSRPGILFLDEPATGLDPGLEKKLMQLLHALSRDSRPIVTITHSTKHLPLCDKLAVMARGGVLVFYGSPAEALEFFEVAEYDDIYVKLDENPTDRWMQDPRRLTMYPPPASQAAAARAPVRPYRDRQPPVVPQAAVLARRYRTLLLRDRRNLAILLGQVPILALAIAIGFNKDIFSGGSPFSGGGSKINAPTFLFVTAITAMWLGAIASAREIVKEKSVFLRERAVGVSIDAYLISKTVVLFALSAVQTLILAAILFGLRPLHATGSAYAAVLIVLLLTSLAAVGMGLFASTLARSEDQASSFIPLLLIPQLLFGGSIIPLVGKGAAFKVLAGLMVARWSFAGLGAANHLNDSSAVVGHYGSLFAHPVALMVIAVAVFPAVFLVAVRYRLIRQTD